MRNVLLSNMSAPMKHMGLEKEKVYFPLKSGASLVKTRPVFSYDQKALFVCSGIVIKVYSISSGLCVHELCGHRDYVTGIAIHPRNKLQLVSCSLDQNIIIWDYTDGVLLRKIHMGGSLHGIYTVLADRKIYILQQKTRGDSVCDLIALNILKDVEEKKRQSLMEACEPDSRKTCVGPMGAYFVSVKGINMWVMSGDDYQNYFHKVGRDQEFTCVVGHPNGQCIATGCKDGKIMLWYNFLREYDVVTSVLHWHSLPVRDLCYTLEGSYLLSVGLECVLVKWHQDSGYKDFMPRLGAPLNHVACSQENLLYATCSDDNVIQIISSNFSIEQVYQGLTRGHNESRSMVPFPAGMTCDPRTEALVLNGKPGHIQFYSIHEDKQLYNLDIVCQNFISPEDVDKPLSVTEVIQADFDSNGSWLATIEYWNDGVMTPEMRLKFWQFSEKKQSFVLNTTVEMPHEDKVHSLKFRPVSPTSSPGMEHMAVTSGYDGKFKVWLLVDDTDIYRSNVKWICESVGFYRNLNAGETAFSEDGSLLTVLFGSCITLWNPENNLLKHILQNTAYKDSVRHVVFGNHGSCHCLVSTTEKAVTVWNLTTCSVLWSAAVEIRCLCKDPQSDIIAAFTRTNDLYVFRPSDPTPVFSYPGVGYNPVLSAAFVPHSKKSLYEKTTLSWQSQSELYFMNKNQELLGVSLEPDTRSIRRKEDVVTYEQNLPQSALSMLVSRHSKKGRIHTSKDRVAKLPDEKFTKEILNSAAHVQPSVNTLCRPFIHSLLTPVHRKRPEDNDSDDESSEEKTTPRTYQTVSLDSGLDSDMEVDTTGIQSNIAINSSQSQADTDSDEDVLNVLKKGENEKRNRVVEAVCEKLDKVKVSGETVSSKKLDEIFSSDLSWYTSRLKGGKNLK